MKEGGSTKRTVRARAAVSLLALALSGCVSLQRYDALEQDYQHLKQQMSAELAADQVEITRLQGQLKVTMKSDLLFPSGGALINPQAQQALGKLAPTLIPLQNTRVVIPITSRLDPNWREWGSLPTYSCRRCAPTQ